MKSLVQLEAPKNYYALIQKVGSEGNYQFRLFMILALNWLVATLLLMGTSLLYLNPPLVCDDKGLTQFQCRQQVCAMDASKWPDYTARPLAVSISTEFGPYQCSDEGKLNLLRAVMYAGVFVGYMVFLFFADNFGRRVSMLLSWGVTVVGLFLLSISWSMSMASTGLFLAGAGCESSIRIGMAILSEVTSSQLRQKYSVALQSSFGISGILIGVMFWLTRQWRVIIISCCFLPSVLVLFLFALFLEETPKYLLKKGAPQTILALNRIAKVNNSEARISYNDIAPYINQRQNTMKVYTPLDLFREPSLRTKTLASSGIFFCLTYLYIGPIVIVDKLGFSPFRSQIIVSSSELIVYPLAFCMISLTPRRKSGYLMLTLSAIFTGILIFAHKPSDCDNCFQGNLEIVMIFCSRFCVSLYFTFFFVYITELFPLSTRALGFGIASSAGAIASTTSQVIMPFFQQHNIDPMILLTFLALLCLVFVRLLPETLDVPLRDDVQEIPQIQEQMESSESYQKGGRFQEWSFVSVIRKQLGIITQSLKNHSIQSLKYLTPSLGGFQPLNDDSL